MAPAQGWHALSATCLRPGRRRAFSGELPGKLCIHLLWCELGVPVMPVSGQEHPSHAFHCRAIQQRKLLSSRWFDAPEACLPTSLFLRRSVFVHRHRYAGVYWNTNIKSIYWRYTKLPGHFSTVVRGLLEEDLLEDVAKPSVRAIRMAKSVAQDAADTYIYI